MKMVIYEILNKSSWQWQPIIALNIHEKSHLKINIFLFLFQFKHVVGIGGHFFIGCRVLITANSRILGNA
jgi:hypothetical protein